MKLKGSLGCSNHELVELKILRASRIGALKAHYPGLQESRLWPLQGPTW